MSELPEPGAAEDWIRDLVEPVGPLETVKERPWGTVRRIPLADRSVFFKVCPPVVAFEPRLTAELFDRWPDRVVEVLGYNDEHSWLLLADAGMPVGEFNDPLETWLEVLPRYAELQMGERAHVRDHLAHGVPSMRLATLPAWYDHLLQFELPLQPNEVWQLRDFAPRFAELCDELSAYGIPETIQHDDLHHANLFIQGGSARVLDWGDTSIAHPFASLVVTFRFLEWRSKLVPGDPWFARLRDAYLEPWGEGLRDAFELALRVGSFSRAFAYVRLLEGLPEADWTILEADFPKVLRRAIAQVD